MRPVQRNVLCLCCAQHSASSFRLRRVHQQFVQWRNTRVTRCMKDQNNTTRQNMEAALCS